VTIKLRRYWLEFNVAPHPAMKIGVGVTAWNLDDARTLVTSAAVSKVAHVEPSRVVEDVDLRELDQSHVLPNAVVATSVRGIWYPQGFAQVMI
jgi:hypothetical protein